VIEIFNGKMRMIVVHNTWAGFKLTDGVKNSLNFDITYWWVNFRLGKDWSRVPMKIEVNVNRHARPMFPSYVGNIHIENKEAMTP